MKYLLLIVITLLLLGCNSDRPEGKLVGTMSVYRTPNGSMTVVNDQDGNSMVFDFHLKSVLVLKKPDEQDHNSN